MQVGDFSVRWMYCVGGFGGVSVGGCYMGILCRDVVVWAVVSGSVVVLHSLGCCGTFCRVVRY